jgi:Flp pilus assembly pilin Flp
LKTLKDIYEKLYKKIFNVLRSERGQGLVEYILIIILVSLVLVIALSSSGVSQAVCNAGSKIASAIG